VDYIGVVICAAIGVVIIIVMVAGCLCFGLARRFSSGACGAGIKKKPLQPQDKTKRAVLSVIVLALVGAIA